MEALFAEAARLGIAVKLAPLEPPLRGAFIPARNTILLDRALVLPQRRETLAHELGHAHHGHDCTDERTEAQAWRWAARFTFDAAGYATAEALNPSPAAIALELGVTPRLVEAWQRYCIPALLRHQLAA